jgi:hypothetical protein
MRKTTTSSNNGATILIALLFFLVCAIAGAIILAAATTSSGRIAGLAGQEQTFYSVTSAADLIRDDIENQNFDYYSEEDEDGNTVTDGTYAAEKPGGKLSALLSTAAESVFKTGNAYTGDITITPDTTETADAMGTVTGTYTMNLDYSLTFTLYSKDKPDEYKCSLTIPADITMDKTARQIVATEDDGTTTTTVRTETSLTWGSGKIGKVK